MDHRMQSKGGGRFDGGWGAFEPENTHLHLNHIPFADHGALLDPPTSRRDRALRILSGADRYAGGGSGDAARPGVPAPRAGDGWKLVRPLGHELHLRHVVGAVRVERGRVSHDDPRSASARLAFRCSATTAAGARTRKPTAAPPGRYNEFTPSQTAWAVLGLMAAGEADHPAVARGIAYLWRPAGRMANGRNYLITRSDFPRVFYLRYHGYRLYFPLLALARYRNSAAWQWTTSGVGFLEQIALDWNRLLLKPLQRAVGVQSNTTRGKYIDTTQFGRSTISLIRKSPATLHSIYASTGAMPCRRDSSSIIPPVAARAASIRSGPTPVVASYPFASR